LRHSMALRMGSPMQLRCCCSTQGGPPCLAGSKMLLLRYCCCCGSHAEAQGLQGPQGPPTHAVGQALEPPSRGAAAAAAAAATAAAAENGEHA
ncbi:hypothetical protein ETH_00043090, partial [Eimeria tenella]